MPACRRGSCCPPCLIVFDGLQALARPGAHEGTKFMVLEVKDAFYTLWACCRPALAEHIGVANQLEDRLNRRTQPGEVSVLPRSTACLGHVGRHARFRKGRPRSA